MKDEIQLSQFPTTRYQGSKRKILPWIFKNIRDLKFDSVLDACGGSGSVSYLFKKMNKTVTYNDNLKFNYIIGKALIANQKYKFTSEDVTNLLSTKNGHPDLISRMFEGIYYLTPENKWLDQMGFGILNMNHYTGEELDYKKSLAHYALFQACLTKRPFNLFHRNNLNIRTADVKRNFGNKKTWEKDFTDVFRNFVIEANSRVFDSGKKCQSTNLSLFDIENINHDLVYIDPPYISKGDKNETSNYLRCYHFLEGIVNYDKWEPLINTDTANKRLMDSDTDIHFNRENIYTSFENMIEKFRKSKIIISYKQGGMPSIQYIVSLMKNYKKTVYTRSQHYIYALNRQNGDVKKNREVLIIGI